MELVGGENVKIPELAEWEVDDSKSFFYYENETVIARYDRLGFYDTDLSIFYIMKSHYKMRMYDIVKHLNYFLTFFDTHRESYLSMLSVKYMVDTYKDMKEENFIHFVLERIITPSFVRNCQDMANYLYHININTDPEGKYKNSPKITNAQGKQILALSFCYRFILPLCIHYSNIGTTFTYNDPDTGKPRKRTYQECFSKLFVKVLDEFEKQGEHIYNTLCLFIRHRAMKTAQNNKTIFQQKKQLRGDTIELYIEEIIRHVILVKSLYKLDYRRSCVSFIDGVVESYSRNYNKENYPSKPTEIDSADTSKDPDDHLSQAESIEMQAYKIDESNTMINDVNIARVMKQIEDHARVLHVAYDTEEYKFYEENLKFTEVSDTLYHEFYSKYFQDAYAVYSLTRRQRVLLQLYMKKYFERTQMPIIAQMCTARVRGKYKENVVKNAKFIEKMSTHPIYEQILSTKFKYLKELGQKEDPILKKLSGIINCTFEFVDYDPELNGMVVEDFDIDEIIKEFLLFLTIT